MRFYVDTEFLHTSRTIDLISIGVVAEDGRELYAVSSDMPWSAIMRNDWLVANVVPALPLRADWDVPLLDRRHPDVKSRVDIRRQLMTFFLSSPDAVEMWGWYSGFDYVVLSQLFGTMLDWPRSLPMWINDLRQDTERLGAYQLLPVQQQGEHHALADARWNKEVGEFLRIHERCKDWDE